MSDMQEKQNMQPCNDDADAEPSRVELYYADEKRPRKIASRIFLTADGKNYRRWISVVISWPLLGVAQFLAGRRFWGVFCFFGVQALSIVLIAVLSHPAVPWAINQEHVALLGVVLWLAVAVDAARHPFPRMPLKKWVSSVAAFIMLYVVVVFLPAFAFRSFIAQSFKVVPASSMEPTLKGNRMDGDGEIVPGDQVWVNRLAYRSHEPQRGDVVVFKTAGIPHVQQNTYFIKRVAGLPGETVGIEPPHLVVDEERILEPSVFREIAARKNGHCGYMTAQSFGAQTFLLTSPTNRITLGADEYLMLGDNSANSFDGRYWGPVKRQSIIGKAEIIYAPADRKRKL